MNETNVLDKIYDELYEIKNLIQRNREPIEDEVVGLGQIIDILQINIEKVHNLLEYEVLPVVRIHGTVISTRRSITDWVRENTGREFF